MRPTPALIAGGGPAGSVAALLLAQGGDRPLVLERSREPQDALCGGFLSWRTLESLANVGIDPAMLGGHIVRRVVLFAGRGRAESPCPPPPSACRACDSTRCCWMRHGRRVRRSSAA
ncbi:NAD(P)/FAD-dependent oxidoreductase [Sphingomonas panni]